MLTKNSLNRYLIGDKIFHLNFSRKISQEQTVCKNLRRLHWINKRLRKSTDIFYKTNLRFI